MTSQTRIQPPVISFAIDNVALASLGRRLDEAPPRPRCSVCDTPISEARPTTGLLLWTRGDQIRADEPPLCGRCATTIGVTALARWSEPSDER